MKITINGERKEIPGEMDLRQLLELLSMPTERVAVELNRRVVKKAEWEAERVGEDDRVEIIHFVGGG
jgi:thiamine biosynthesis protein ThiS